MTTSGIIAEEERRYYESRSRAELFCLLAVRAPCRQQRHLLSQTRKKHNRKGVLKFLPQPSNIRKFKIVVCCAASGSCRGVLDVIPWRLDIHSTLENTN
jgi:hypothetical protein